ncbi:nitrate- and nitrite sensing domain-containing protein [Phytohabitans sp. ZYX-F-186]|uniref:histidine kinase n=1 Tax=Phytohabitans maris TaxID=3071409 RepID=A0ABU0ZNN6_9ACTN|nr:nitrate- and nitrite sensing domain-containing protein [Phytohabitans sp. ZYX-F-186]MDQ7907865.1 nitrate- and nitrite sensing domain-containing protein [Phytohabitans sp. ZYX-F-186]
MNTGDWSIRAKIIALITVPLAALLALWIFTTTLTLGPALNLLSAQTFLDEVGRPGESMVSELQRERRLSLVYLAGKGDLPALSEQRNRTDAAVTEFRRRAGDPDLRDAADGRLRTNLDQLFTSLDLLTTGRGFIDRREMDQAGALGLYSGVVDGAFRVFEIIADVDDEELNREARAVTSLGRAREVLGQSDALLAGAFAAGKFSGGEHAQLVQIIGAHRYLFAQALPALPDTERIAYQRMTEGEAFTRLRSLEDRVIAQGRDGQAPSVTASAWQSAYEPAILQLREFELSSSDALADRATPVAVGVLLRLALAGLLGLAAIALSLLISLRVGRSLIRRLSSLRESAMDLADRRLPGVVARLRRGEEVDVAEEAPPLEYGSDEIGQLGRAFTEAQRTAVQAAVDEATLRQGFNEVFLNIARRSQALLHRQLALLDSMERRSTDPDELENLFRVDHLATRMRRHAEDLVILAGSAPGRGWRNPVGVIDVIRGGVSEVEDYSRVAITKIEPANIAGRAVGDMIHLLAELIENATSYSPPETKVQVTGASVPNGYAIEIEDRGLGMTPELLGEANRKLSRPPDFDPANSAQLGLFVVAQLGARHGVKIQLRNSPYGGITAIVLIPPDLVTPPPEPAALPAAPSNGETPRMRRARALASVDSGPRRSLEAVARPVLVPAPVIDAEPTDATPSAGADGLPKRVRQASLAPQLRGEPAGPLTLDRVDPEPPPRSAEQARATMSALQAGTARGRRDADAIPTPRPEPGAVPLARRDADPVPLARREPGPVPLARRDPDALPFAGRGPAAPDPTETQFLPLAMRPTRQVVEPPVDGPVPLARRGGADTPGPLARGTATPPPGAIVTPPSGGDAGGAPEVIDGLPRRKRGATVDGPAARRSTSGGLPRRKAGEGPPVDDNGDRPARGTGLEALRLRKTGGGLPTREPGPAGDEPASADANGHGTPSGANGGAARDNTPPAEPEGAE